MEKPVAVDAPGVRARAGRHRGVAKKKDLAVGVGLQRRHQAAYLETIKRLQDGAIGDIVCTRVYWNGAGVWVQPAQAAGPDRDGIPDAQLVLLHLALRRSHRRAAHPQPRRRQLGQGRVSRARPTAWAGGQVRTGKEYGEIFDHHAVEFEYADGSRMFSQCRHIPGCWNSVSEHAHGTKGTADISGATIEAAGSETVALSAATDADPYQVEHDDLFASIRAGNPINEAENGAQSTMTAILGRMATYSGKVVAWDEAIASEISLAPKEYSFTASPPVPSIAVPGVTQVV